MTCIVPGGNKFSGKRPRGWRNDGGGGRDGGRKGRSRRRGITRWEITRDLIFNDPAVKRRSRGTDFTRTGSGWGRPPVCDATALPNLARRAVRTQEVGERRYRQLPASRGVTNTCWPTLTVALCWYFKNNVCLGVCWARVLLRHRPPFSRRRSCTVG